MFEGLAVLIALSGAICVFSFLKKKAKSVVKRVTKKKK